MRFLTFALSLSLSIVWAAKAPMTSETIWDLRAVSDPQISHDGKSVVYVLTYADKLNDTFHSNLWLVSADGKKHQPITQGDFRDSSPRWSPDGTRIAYLSTRAGKPQIFVRWLDTGQEAKITDLQEAPSAIAWSPDGQNIAFLARVPAKPDWVVKMPDKPAGAKWADPPIAITKLNWRGDAVGIRPQGYNHIFVMPALGGAPRQISSGDYDHVAPLAWTHDGESILCSAVRAADADYLLEGGEIYSFSIKDGAVRALTSRKGPDTYPVPSPDGKKIAYLGYDDQGRSYHVVGLYVMDSDGGNAHQLAAKLDRDVIAPTWSEDSKQVYFVADDHGGSQLYSAMLDGSFHALTSGRHRLVTSYGSGPGGFTIAANGRVAITRSTVSEPADVFTFSVDQPSKLSPLTNVNEGLLASHSLGEVEEISYDSFDGRSIQGWIVKPPQFDPARKYPFILDIHGGPHGMYGVEFGHQFQNYAARGFVVLYVNPRGSTGYGQEFGDVIHAKYPGDDYKDLMAGVDAMLAKGYVDPKKLCVTGGSGGGLLTAWIIGHTDRFAAAVSQYPVTNWFTQAGTADIGLLMTRWMKAAPWENPQQYLDRSPIFFAKNFKTPTMVLTGEQDFRTPIAQSEELYFALKMRKVDTVLVRIPDEPHGIRGTHPSHRIAKVENILAWMDKYAKP